MRIAIITATFQNYGSRLQNLATVELLKKKYPNSKIHTLVPSKTNNKIRFFLGKLAIFRFLFLKTKFRGKINKDNRLLHYRVFFIRDYSLQELDFLNKKYDLFVIGSDQIWNFPNDQKSNFLFGIFTTKKICNAPSFSISKNTSCPRMAELLKSFNDLSVREEYVAKYIENQLGIKCNYQLDPTLRLPVNAWNKFIKKRHRANGYYLVYILENKLLLDKICTELRNSNINYLTIFNKNDGVEKFQHTPTEFINIVANSSCVITNSFHGACMAKIFNKKLRIHNNNCASDARFNIFKNYKEII